MSQIVPILHKYTRTNLRRSCGIFSPKTCILCSILMNHPPQEVKLRHNKKLINPPIRSEEQWRKQIGFNVGIPRKS